MKSCSVSFAISDLPQGDAKTPIGVTKLLNSDRPNVNKNVEKQKLMNY